MNIVFPTGWHPPVDVDIFLMKLFHTLGTCVCPQWGCVGKKTITWSSSDKHTSESMLGLLGFRGATYSWSDGKWRSGMENLKTAIKVSGHYFLKCRLNSTSPLLAMLPLSTFWLQHFELIVARGQSRFLTGAPAWLGSSDKGDIQSKALQTSLVFFFVNLGCLMFFVYINMVVYINYIGRW